MRSVKELVWSVVLLLLGVGILVLHFTVEAEQRSTSVALLSLLPLSGGVVLLLRYFTKRR